MLALHLALPDAGEFAIYPQALEPFLVGLCTPGTSCPGTEQHFPLSSTSSLQSLLHGSATGQELSHPKNNPTWQHNCSTLNCSSSKQWTVTAPQLVRDAASFLPTHKVSITGGYKDLSSTFHDSPAPQGCFQSPKGNPLFKQIRYVMNFSWRLFSYKVRTRYMCPDSHTMMNSVVLYVLL